MIDRCLFTINLWWAEPSLSVSLDSSQAQVASVAASYSIALLRLYPVGRPRLSILRVLYRALRPFEPLICFDMMCDTRIDGIATARTNLNGGFPGPPRACGVQ